MKNSLYINRMALLGEIDKDTYSIFKRDWDKLDKSCVDIEEFYNRYTPLGCDKFELSKLLQSMISLELDKHTINYVKGFLDFVIHIFPDSSTYDFVLTDLIYKYEFKDLRVFKYDSMYGSSIRLRDKVYKLGLDNKEVVLKDDKGIVYRDIAYIECDVNTKNIKVVTKDIEEKHLVKGGNKYRLLLDARYIKSVGK